VEQKIPDEAMAAALELAESGGDLADRDPEELLRTIEPFRDLTGPEVAVLPVKIQFYVPTIICEQLNSRPAGSVQTPDEMAVACDDTGTQKQLLDASTVLGTDVNDAGAVIQPGTNRWEVNLEFNSEGQGAWTALTREAVQNDQGAPFDPAALGMNVVSREDGWSFDNSQEASSANNRYTYQTSEDGVRVPVQCGQEALGDQGNCLVATVLDNVVVVSPQIQGVITSNARITGDFGAEEAQLLASQLRFGALPLTFAPQESQTITATLGEEYLKAGLLAAAIGVALVLVYMFFYYRLLGIVIFGSLLISSVLIYAALVVLGRNIGFTLTLAGITGFIVAVGVAADSFVIYFERLKDEIREGRTPRSAIPRAWVRARRTIVTANAVTLLAVVVLYLLSAGQVRGFAFALGLATILDLLVVFTFRHPIMALLARTPAFLSPTVSGLGRALELDRARQAAMRPTRTREA
jgi:preprotein translocase subunit SecD